MWLESIKSPALYKDTGKDNYFPNFFIYTMYISHARAQKRKET